MEKVLFIAYQFPPRGGPGVHRSLNFVKHLRAFGYDPVVLTVTEEDVKRSGHLYDESLLAQLPPDIKIVRAPSHEPVELIRSLMKWKLFRPVWFLFFHRFWEWSALWPSRTYELAARLVDEHNIKLVYTSSSPYSSLKLGNRLKRKKNIRWVADLRDPFTDGYGWPWPSKLHWRLDRVWERKILAAPDLLIVNTPEVKKLYLRRGISTEAKIEVLTNGY